MSSSSNERWFKITGIGLFISLVFEALMIGGIAIVKPAHGSFLAYYSPILFAVGLAAGYYLIRFFAVFFAVILLIKLIDWLRERGR
ncbi:hypothetical protein K3G63_05180 [Hymenobacter sp. HSC-4F20]|uniref:hypothetical protein n=1 Tax=Hymenobacter sp. HSC-4F20 TaxID=2864135 RepID=UPI001C73DDB7|nr:hypothetical protein [Hymenobacter sp. HSC-4F20]MBX0289819.1 hypothetical protein [Hymenobacter sp. HSC-4F20]